VPTAGLVPDQDVPDTPTDEGVVGRQVRTAGEAEDDIHALRLQTFHYCIHRAHRTDLLS
jgi:hypothetical protein